MCGMLWTLADMGSHSQKLEYLQGSQLKIGSAALVASYFARKMIIYSSDFSSQGF